MSQAVDLLDDPGRAKMFVAQEKKKKGGGGVIFSEGK